MLNSLDRDTRELLNAMILRSYLFQDSTTDHLQDNSSAVASILANPFGDDAAIFGKLVAEKLRNLPEKKKDRAMKDIFKIIYTIQYEDDAL